MKLIFLLLMCFVGIGLFSRKFDNKARWLVLLVSAGIVLYATIR